MARIAGSTALAALASMAVLAGPASADAGDPPGAFYLDLGASVSLGVQPTGSFPREARTTTGYANDVVAEQGALGDPLRLVQLGCPGETVTALAEGGGRCYRTGDSQLAEAVAFLHDHADDRGLVTIDIGFDDVDHCLWHESVAPACVDAGLSAVGRQLPQVLDSLRDAAGVGVRLIGVGAYDPFLADAVRDPSGQPFALASETVIARLNATLAASFGAAGIPMVDVASVIAGQNPRDAAGDPAALVAMAEHTCDLTWMCAAAPFGPNIHPNDDGYAAIARAVEATLPHDDR